MTPRTIFFQSLGCAKNLVDTEVMLGIALKDQFRVVPEPQNAEVIVVNTCSFIEASKRESIDTILTLAEHKQSGTCKRLVVAGCLPQRYKEDLKVSFPEVDAFIGTGQYGQLLEFIDGKKEEEAFFKHPKYIHSENTPRINSQPFYRAYLKISEGCIKNCSFCIIPKIRGTLRSRTIPSLVAEATRLVQEGAKELNLISQDTTDYGRDLRNGTTLPDLLRALVRIEGLEWVRLLYVYPDELSDELIDLIASEPKLCKYLDMPVQHISDRILLFMNRKVTGTQIRERIARLRNRIPGISLRSTIMTGFPGETEADFLDLLAFVKEAKFDHLGVFAYSHEENTASYVLPDQIAEPVKEERRHQLLLAQQSVSSAVLSQKQGKHLRVLVEEPTGDSKFPWRGRYAGQAPDVDGNILLQSNSLSRGTFIDVTVTKALEYDLVANQISGDSTQALYH